MPTQKENFVIDGVSILTCRCYENVWREAKEQKAISLKLMDDFEKIHQNNASKNLFY